MSNLTAIKFCCHDFKEKGRREECIKGLKMLQGNQ